MNNKFHVLDHPMLVYAGFTSTGHTKDLMPGIIGVFDAKSGNAVAPANINMHAPVRFAQGSYHKKDALGKFYTGLKKSLKTADFLPKDVMHVEFSPFRQSQNEKWIIGWDGLSDPADPCNTLRFECGKTHKFRFRIYGEGVYNEFTKQILRDVSVTTACCDSDECAGGCPDNTVHCRNYTKKLVDAINKDVEISRFIRAEVVLPAIPVHPATHKLMCLTVCDNGDQESMNAIQRQYPGMAISRIAREGSLSTYQTGCMPNATVVADYVPTASVLLAACGTCGSGYTLVPEGYKYVVTRPLAGTEDLTSPALQLVAATNIASSYGGTSPKYLTHSVAGITVEFTLPTNTLVAELADLILSITHVPAMCTPTTAADPIAWVKCGDRYITTQKKCMILGKDCGGANRLADIQAAYVGDLNIVPGSVVLKTAGNCEDVYEIEQYSGCMEDGCLTEPNPEFPAIKPFENTLWSDCPCEAEAVPTQPNACGIRFEVSSNYTKFDECSWVPEDYFTYKPTMMEVWEVEEDGEPCKAQVKARKIQDAIQKNQDGEWARREYINLAAYLYQAAFDTDPRLREILETSLAYIIDRNAFYNVYYVKYKQYRGNNFPGNMQNPETYEIPIIVKEGIDTSTFETYLNAMFGSNGVTVRPRINQIDY